jgi:hemolysin activation/secretion protein
VFYFLTKAVFVLLCLSQSVMAASTSISQIQINGNAAVSDQALERLVKPFIGKPITQERLDNIRATVFDEYSRLGFLARIDLPAQDLSEGVIAVTVNEAQLGEVSVQAPDDLRFSQDKAKAYIEHTLRDQRPLSIEQLDARAKVLDELPGLSAEVKVKPIAESALVDADLLLGNTALLSTTLQTDNLGSETTGRHRYTADFQFNSLFSLGEKVVVGAIKSEALTTYSIDAEFPVGFDGVKTSIGTDRTSYGVNDDRIAVDGISRGAWLRLRLPETLWGALPVNRELGVEYSASKDDSIRADGKTDRVKDKDTKRLYGSASVAWVAPAGDAAVNVTTKATLGVFDLSKLASVYQGDLSGARAHGRFTKLNIDIAAQKRLSPQSSLTATATCQLTNKNLYSGEEIELSGPTAVRAYAVGAVSADQGCYVQSELINQFTDKIAGYAFVDVGYAQTNKSTYTGWQTDNEANRFAIKGAGVGARIAATDAINLSLSYARRLGSCDGCTDTLDNGRFWAVATGSF